MPRTPTGRPPGRPKTKEYATLVARMPQPLVNQARRYARAHGCSISILLREGLEWRLNSCDTATVPVPEAMPPAPQVVGEDSSHTETAPPAAPAAVGDGLGDTETVHVPTPLADSRNTPTIPPFDQTRHVLGKLCRRGHEWGNTGQSLLRKANLGCLKCDAEGARERRRQKRQQR
jgi:hypothetical protein